VLCVFCESILIDPCTVFCCYVKEYGDSALTQAAKRGHSNAVKLLIEYGANINHQVRRTLVALSCPLLVLNICSCKNRVDVVLFGNTAAVVNTRLFVWCLTEI